MRSNQRHKGGYDRLIATERDDASELEALHAPQGGTTALNMAALMEQERKTQDANSPVAPGPRGGDFSPALAGRMETLSRSSTHSSSARSKKPPQTLSEAHKKWILQILAVTLVVSILVIGWVAVSSNFGDDGDGHGACAVGEMDRMLSWSLQHSATREDVPTTLKSTYTIRDIPANLPDPPTSANFNDGGTLPRTNISRLVAVVAMCDGTFEKPFPNAQPCVGTRTVQNDTTAAPPRQANILSIWDQETGECVEYFTGGNADFKMAEKYTTSSFYIEGGVENHGDAPDTLVRFRVSTEPNAKLRVRFQCGEHGGSGGNATEAATPQISANFVARSYSMTIPAPFLCRKDEKDFRMKDIWTKKLQESRGNDHNSHRGKKSSQFVSEDIMVPVLVMFILPSLAVVAILLYRQNRKLSTVIKSGKKLDASSSSGNTSRSSSSSVRTPMKKGAVTSANNARGALRSGSSSPSSRTSGDEGLGRPPLGQSRQGNGRERQLPTRSNNNHNSFV